MAANVGMLLSLICLGADCYYLIVQDRMADGIINFYYAKMLFLTRERVPLFQKNITPFKVLDSNHTYSIKKFPANL